MADPLLIAKIVSDFTPSVLKLIKKGLDKNDTVPDKDLVARAIERLCTINAFNPKNIPAKGTAEFLEMWLEDLLSTATNIDPKLDVDALKKFLETCQGAPHGTDILPKNRPMIPTPAENGGKTVKYLFEVDRSSIPKIPGFTKDDFVDLVKGAWQRWLIQDLVDRTKLTVKMKEDGSRGTANLTVGFGTLDGSGTKLAETETRWSSDAPSQYTILVDSSEDWTEAKLLATMIHEIGHALGLDHVNDSSAIMSAFLDPSFNDLPLKQVVLQPADVAALQHTDWV